MVQAKTELRERARELRRAGKSYAEIVAELGVAKSSVSLWVRDLPMPTQRRSPKEQMDLMRAGLRRLRNQQDEERKRITAEATQEIGKLSDRELFMAGIALYWAEGSKSKAYARREFLQFVNSDPDVIKLFLAWVQLLGVTPDRLRFHVSIHESADAAQAERFWGEVVGEDPIHFGKTVLKRHNPRTRRRNTGDTYRGCLTVYVTHSADLYRRVEGWWYGIVVAAGRTA
ncbi:hypothetical protein [Streptomyces xinghaiensis]|uniref:hypothetical protein n=1 Tax=Streptomyces xinghaiensis TaxID=1038928 RepID=UPI00341C95A4